MSHLLPYLHRIYLELLHIVRTNPIIVSNLTSLLVGVLLVVFNVFGLAGATATGVAIKLVGMLWEHLGVTPVEQVELKDGWGRYKVWTNRNPRVFSQEEILSAKQTQWADQAEEIVDRDPEPTAG